MPPIDCPLAPSIGEPFALIGLADGAYRLSIRCIAGSEHVNLEAYKVFFWSRVASVVEVNDKFDFLLCRGNFPGERVSIVGKPAPFITPRNQFDPRIRIACLKVAALAVGEVGVVVMRNYNHEIYSLKFKTSKIGFNRQQGVLS